MWGKRTAGIIVAAALAATSVSAEIKLVPVPFASDQESREISVVVDPGLKRTKSLPRSLQDARIALLNKETLPAETLKALADRRETLAALRYVDVLMARGIEDNASDVAWYAAIAVGGGRVWALPEMVEALHLLDPKTEPQVRINQYIRVLYPHAWAGNELALDAVIDFNGEGRLFGPLSDSTRERIEAQIAQNGSARGDLRVAVSILSQDTLTPDDKARARVHLERARQADHLAVATTAANLIEQLDAEDRNGAAATN